jgi:farnesyl-diphosphate farnesyltransferase
MQTDHQELLTDLLKEVSRSFYLTLRVLPSEVRDAIGLAYLLARATDTIADTSVVPVADRLSALDRLRDRMLGVSLAPPDLDRCLVAAGNSEATPAELTLLRRLPEALTLLDASEPEDRQRIRRVLVTITSGQKLDLQRFAGATSGHMVALANDAELDDYTYRVAGCVGEFWTAMCRARLFPRFPLDEGTLMTNGVRFGKGLQLVNILRDLPKDLRLGRCYLPNDWLSTHGLQPRDLLDPANMPRFRPFYTNYLKQAETLLADGWAYTNLLPADQRRVRLACAWPILIGQRTLALLRDANVLDPARRVKVSRSEVRGILLRSLLCFPFAGPWNRLHENARR